MDENDRQLYVVAESGANLTGTWYYQRNAGISIGPIDLGEVTHHEYPSPTAAKEAAAEDYRQIHRLAA